MSKFGTINVKVSDHFTSDQLADFATLHHITYEQATSLAKEMLYRKAYNCLRNKTPEVKAVRKAYNQKRHELSKALRTLR
jgi:hypothetical protein